eukprot:snap_masked-scaffold_85-processed-gene-0.25-mRNA-1 protein AED:1.00 eAED:1.00 QI:0/0/0/0/1/1/2/0/66
MTCRNSYDLLSCKTPILDCKPSRLPISSLNINDVIVNQGKSWFFINSAYLYLSFCHIIRSLQIKQT